MNEDGSAGVDTGVNAGVKLALPRARSAGPCSAAALRPARRRRRPDLLGGARAPPALARRRRAGAPGSANRARCERQASSVRRTPRPWKPSASRSAGPPRAAATAARSPSSRASRSNTVPPSSSASAGSGGNAGAPPSRSRRATAGPDVAGLARQPLRGALHEPRVAHPAAQPQRAERRREAGMALRDRVAREQRRRRQHQHLQRALDVRGALGQQPRREHVQLALARPADHVAARGGRGQPPLERRPRAAPRRAAPASRAAPPPARPARTSSWRSSRSRAYSSCASTRSASGASRSSWRATNVSDGGLGPGHPCILARPAAALGTRRAAAPRTRAAQRGTRAWISLTCW